MAPCETVREKLLNLTSTLIHIYIIFIFLLFSFYVFNVEATHLQKLIFGLYIILLLFLY